MIRALWRFVTRPIRRGVVLLVVGLLAGFPVAGLLAYNGAEVASLVSTIVGLVLAPIGLAFLTSDVIDRRFPRILAAVRHAADTRRAQSGPRR